MTIPKWFSRRPKLPRTTKTIAIFSVVLTCLLRPSAVVRADNAPDWFRAAAQEKVPESSKETEAVVLLGEVTTTEKDKGEIETRDRRGYKLLSWESLTKYGGISVPFDGDTKLTYFKAWTITSDGIAYEVKESDATESSFTTYEL